MLCQHSSAYGSVGPSLFTNSKIEAVAQADQTTMDTIELPALLLAPTPPPRLRYNGRSNPRHRSAPMVNAPVRLTELSHCAG